MTFKIDSIILAVFPVLVFRHLNDSFLPFNSVSTKGQNGATMSKSGFLNQSSVKMARVVSESLQ